MGQPFLHRLVHLVNEAVIDAHFPQKVQNPFQGDVLQGQSGLLALLHLGAKGFLQLLLDGGGDFGLQGLGHQGGEGAGRDARPHKGHRHRQKGAQGKDQPPCGPPDGKRGQEYENYQVKY